MIKLYKCLLFAISAGLLASCSTPKNVSGDDDIRPRIKRPTRSIINASGDGLTPSVNPLNGNQGTGGGNAVMISNEAINKAKINYQAQTLKSDSISAKDFLHQASTHLIMETNISKIALDNTNNNQIKDYAGKVIASNGLIRSALKKLAANLNVNLTDTNNINVSRMQALTTAKDNDGTNAFNFNYVQLMIDDQRNAIGLFEAVKNSKEPQVVAFANKHLPLLQQNFTAVQELTKLVRATKTKQ